MKRDDKGQYTSSSEFEISTEMNRLIDLYIESLQSQKSGTKQTTIDTRRTEVRYWLAYCERQDIDPLKAKEDHVRGYIQSKNHLSNHTVSSYLSSLQSFYSIIKNDQMFEELELEHGHPTRDADLRDDYEIRDTSAYRIEVAKYDEDVLIDIENIRKLFNCVTGKKRSTRLRNRVLVMLNFYTGCRAEELANMRVNNINWDKNYIRIESAKIDTELHPELTTRKVPFPKDFAFTLRRYVEDIRPDYSQYGSLPEDIPKSETNSPYLFVTHQSPKMSKININDVVKDAAFSANKEHGDGKHDYVVQEPLRPRRPESPSQVKEWLVTTHRVRRSAISHWVNECDNITLLHAKRLAGHVNLSQTIEYVEEDEDGQIEAYQKDMR